MPNYRLLNYPNVGESHGNYRAKNEMDAADAVLTELGERLGVSNNSDNAFVVFTIQAPRKKATFVGTRVELVKPGKKGERYRNIITKLDARKDFESELRELIYLE